jgi:hypothetical protein
MVAAKQTKDSPTKILSQGEANGNSTISPAAPDGAALFAALFAPQTAPAAQHVYPAKVGPVTVVLSELAARVNGVDEEYNSPAITVTHLYNHGLIKRLNADECEALDLRTWRRHATPLSYIQITEAGRTLLAYLKAQAPAEVAAESTPPAPAQEPRDEPTVKVIGPMPTCYAAYVFRRHQATIEQRAPVAAPIMALITQATVRLERMWQHTIRYSMPHGCYPSDAPFAFAQGLIQPCPF